MAFSFHRFYAATTGLAMEMRTPSLRGFATKMPLRRHSYQIAYDRPYTMLASRSQLRSMSVVAPAKMAVSLHSFHEKQLLFMDRLGEVKKSNTDWNIESNQKPKCPRRLCPAVRA